MKMVLVVCLSFDWRSKTFSWQKISGGPGGHELEHVAAICHGDKDGDWFLGCIRQRISVWLREVVLAFHSALVMRPYL